MDIRGRDIIPIIFIGGGVLGLLGVLIFGGAGELSKIIANKWFEGDTDKGWIVIAVLFLVLVAIGWLVEEYKIGLKYRNYMFTRNHRRKFKRQNLPVKEVRKRKEIKPPDGMGLTDEDRLIIRELQAKGDKAGIMAFILSVKEINADKEITKPKLD